MFLTRPTVSPFVLPPIQRLFSDTPALRVMKQPDMWSLDGPLKYLTPAGTVITIPKGMITDLASVPKVLDWVPWLDINGDSRLPGVLHDGIYKLGRERGKAFADGLLRQACLDVGMTAWQAETYYRGVEWFGRHGWDTDGSDIMSLHFATDADFKAWMAAGATIYH